MFSFWGSEYTTYVYAKPETFEPVQMLPSVLVLLGWYQSPQTRTTIKHAPLEIEEHSSRSCQYSRCIWCKRSHINLMDKLILNVKKDVLLNIRYATYFGVETCFTIHSFRKLSTFSIAWCFNLGYWIHDPNKQFSSNINLCLNDRTLQNI